MTTGEKAELRQLEEREALLRHGFRVDPLTEAERGRVAELRQRLAAEQQLGQQAGRGG